MRNPAATEVGWRIAKVAALVVILITLAGFTMLSHAFSNARAGRIACLANQRAMEQALALYQSAHAGSDPETLDELAGFYAGPSRNFGRCSAHRKDAYSYDAGLGTFHCSNKAHGSDL